MSSYHKPRVFRSNDGCCICKAKSSSSRFTDSGKYENSFTTCFKLDESHKRHGDICNACVLIVKRWRVLPKDTDKDWHHVVDSRVGPGGSKVTFRNVKRKAEPESEEKFEKIRKKKQKLTVKRVTEHVDNISDSISGFIDTTYFKRKTICCGVIFEGLCGEVMIDQRLFKRCPHHTHHSLPSTSSTASLSSISVSTNSIEAVNPQKEKSKQMFDDSDDNVDDTDSFSFYSDDIESVSKYTKDDILSHLEDEGFYDKSEMKSHLDP